MTRQPRFGAVTPRAYSRLLLALARLGLVAGAVLVALLAGEGLCRLFIPRAVFYPVSNVYRPSEIPGLSYTLQPNFSGFAFGTEVRANSAGFRGPEWSRPKEPGVFRILLLGDSHAFGIGVPFAQTMGELIAEKLHAADGRRYEVLNLALPGYNSRQELAAYQHFAPELAPDLVLVVPCSNDDLPAFVADDQGWLHHPGDQPGNKITSSPLVRPASGWLKHSRLYLTLRLLFERRQHARAQEELEQTPGTGPGWMGEVPEGPIPEELLTQVYTPLRQLIDACRERKVPVIVAPFAAPARYRRLFHQLGAETGTPLIELLALFPGMRDWNDVLEHYGLGWDPHLGPAAQVRFADAVVETIRRLPDQNSRATRAAFE